MSRDGAIPLSRVWYHMDHRVGGPVRAIWLCVVLAFILGTPGLTNPTVLGALFSLTATGLYSSYIIPILLRITVSRHTFVAAEFSLGRYSIAMGWISVIWMTFMIITLCLPQVQPITINNMNYSPIALGIVIILAIISWVVSARHWFKGSPFVIFAFLNFLFTSLFSLFFSFNFRDWYIFLNFILLNVLIVIFLYCIFA